MELIPLHDTDLQVSRLGFGCMSLKPDDDEHAHLLRQAVDAGINFFDTADLYDRGANEAFLGKVLKPVRDQVIIATKVGNRWKDDGSAWEWVPRPEYISEAVEQSLRRLQTDHIDLYQLHGGTIDDPIEDVIETFEQLKSAGKIRAYGISSIRPNVIRTWLDKSACSTVMMQYSILDRRPEEECLDLLAQQGVGLLVRGALAQGILLGKSASMYLDMSAKEVAEIQQKMKEWGDDPAAIALGYVSAHPATTSVVVGMRNEVQLQQAIRAIAAPTMPRELLRRIRTSVPANLYAAHR